MQQENNQQIFNLNSVVHLNNFIFLVFSICTFRIHNPIQCPDLVHENYLKWMLYGNLAVYGTLLIATILFHFGLLDKISNKCGAVVVTLNALGYAGLAVMFDIVSMCYGIKVYFFELDSKCLELQLFAMVCAYIFVVWIVLFILSLLRSCYVKRKKNQDRLKNVNQTGYIGM